MQRETKSLDTLVILLIKSSLTWLLNFVSINKLCFQFVIYKTNLVRLFPSFIHRSVELKAWDEQLKETSWKNELSC